MGCEFSDSLRTGKNYREIVQEVYEQLNDRDKKMFKIRYGAVANIEEKEAYRIYYHCKRVKKQYKTNTEKN